MKTTGMAALLAALMILAGGALAGGATTTFTGTVAGGTQVSGGAPTDHATHTFDAGARDVCTHTVTFTYNGVMGDTFGSTGMEGLVVTAGRDYITHLYLYVTDGEGNDISGSEWIEDDAWEQASATPGLAPTMSHTATLSGACGEWTFTVDAHRGASEYTIEIA